MEVEWLAVSGFGFHGSKPSLLYYGQPLTTAGMQRFASRFPIWERCKDRSVRVSRSLDRQIFLPAHIWHQQISLNLNLVRHDTFQIYQLEFMRACDKCNERKEKLKKRGKRTKRTARKD